MSAGLGFDDPLWLAALPVVLGLGIWAAARSRSRLSVARARAVKLLRLTTLLLLVAALAGLAAWHHDDRLTVIFAVDTSRSIGGAAREAVVPWLREVSTRLPRGDRAGVVAFGERAMVEQHPDEQWRVEGILSRPGENGTDLESAVRLARGLFPANHEARLVLLTDGLENRGDLRHAVAGLPPSIDLVWKPLERTARREVLVERVSVPERIVEDEPHRVRVVVRSSEATAATLRLFRGATLVSSAPVRLEPGRPNVFSVEQSGPDASGVLLYRAEVEVDGDTELENNRASALVRVEGRPRILVLDDDPPTLTSWARTLEHAGLRVEIGRPDALPVDMVSLSAYDGIVFADVPATQLAEGQLAALRRYVHDAGGGFLMLGGPDSFGPGGYWKTPVEEALPIHMELKDWTRHPSVGLVLCIDKSGSMAGMAMESKIEVAKAAAAEVAAQLTEMDRLGVIAFDAAAKWVVPMVGGGDRAEVERRMGTLRAGGGTDAYPAMAEARQALLSSESRVKHVILLTDGQLAARDHEGLARDMEREGITVTTVGVGTDADPYTLERIAHAGGGRYYAARDVLRLPRIFLREAFRVGRNWLVEETFRPVPRASHEVLGGLDPATLPPLAGYVAASEKEAARHLLVTHRGDPLLSVWRYGLGKSAAFTSDVKGRWSGAWLRWPENGAFWQRLVRWTARGRESRERLQATAEVTDGKVRIAADAIDERGGFVNGADLAATVIDPGGEARSVTLVQVAPGRYEGEVEASRPGAYLAAVTGAFREGDEVGATASVAVPYSGEFGALHREPEAMERLAVEGRVRVAAETEDWFAHRGTGGRVRWPLAPWLLTVAALLLVGEIGARKLRWDWRAFLLRRRAAREPSERFRRLQGARGRVRRRIVDPAARAAQEASPAVSGAAAPERAERPAEGETLTSRLLARKRRASTRSRGRDR